jgi:hypothetical protein
LSTITEKRRIAIIGRPEFRGVAVAGGAYATSGAERAPSLDLGCSRAARGKTRNLWKGCEGIQVFPISSAFKAKAPERQLRALEPGGTRDERLLTSHEENARGAGGPPSGASRVFEKVKARGYPGGVAQVRRFVRSPGPAQGEAFLRLSTLPGEQAQMDWRASGKSGSAARSGRSRALCIRCTSPVFRREPDRHMLGG